MHQMQMSRERGRVIARWTRAQHSSTQALVLHQPASMKNTAIRLLHCAVGAALVVAVSASSAAQENRSTGSGVNDAWITTQIFAKYFADPDIKARHIDVSTDRGVVTLGGTVYSENERRQAVAKARATDGVVRVVDKLILTSGKPPITADARDRARAEWPKVQAEGRKAVDRLGKDISDAWITAKVQSKFFLDPAVKGLDISVTTNNGIVMLGGTVSSAAEEKQAIALAQDTDGVKEVVSKLGKK
jgi:osmotically-inducible protein OsmY